VDEIPLILHLSRYAGIDVSSILALRSEGLSWMEVGVRLNIERDSFYVPLASPTTLMPGTSYRDYARRARAAWLIPGLTDADLVNLVNLKFISEYYRCPSEHVIALHSTGWSYSAMHGVLAGLTERAPVARRPSSRRGARDHSQKV
jgi:hypothetical protein